MGPSGAEDDVHEHAPAGRTSLAPHHPKRKPTAKAVAGAQRIDRASTRRRRLEPPPIRAHGDRAVGPQRHDDQRHPVRLHARAPHATCLAPTCADRALVDRPLIAAASFCCRSARRPPSAAAAAPALVARVGLRLVSVDGGAAPSPSRQANAGCCTSAPRSRLYRGVATSRGGKEQPLVQIVRGEVGDGALVRDERAAALEPCRTSSWTSSPASTRRAGAAAAAAAASPDPAAATSSAVAAAEAQRGGAGRTSRAVRPRRRALWSRGERGRVRAAATQRRAARHRLDRRARSCESPSAPGQRPRPSPASRPGTRRPRPGRWRAGQGAEEAL